MKISLFTVLVRVIRRAGQFCVARWRSGLPESSFSQEDWRLGKRRAILWNPIENPFGFRFQTRLGQQDEHSAVVLDAAPLTFPTRWADAQPRMLLSFLFRRETCLPGASYRK